jgi:hypothetical protein
MSILCLMSVDLVMLVTFCNLNVIRFMLDVNAVLNSVRFQFWLYFIDNVFSEIIRLCTLVIPLKLLFIT